MTRIVFRLSSPVERQNACAACLNAPSDHIVEIREATRTLEQNALLWALLRDVSEQVEWDGRYLRPEDWKTIFTASLRKADVAPGIDPGTVVPLGMSTSRLTKKEFSALIELIHAFAAHRGVILRDHQHTNELPGAQNARGGEAGAPSGASHGAGAPAEILRAAQE